MNNVVIKIKQYSTVDTVSDEDFMEVISEPIYESELTLSGQVVYEKQEAETPATTGDIEVVQGRLVFKKVSLGAVELKKGDRIILIAGQVVDYSIHHVKNTGHLNGVANLVMAYFEEPPERDAPKSRR